MSTAKPLEVRLRQTTVTDLPRLFEIESDPAGQRLAWIKPRSWSSFMARWQQALRDPEVTSRVILADGALAGSINAFKQDATDSIGYWIAREHWGQHIATRAIALLLEEVTARPLFARVAVDNVASLRALTRNGFVIAERYRRTETERHIGCEQFTLALR